MPALHSPPADSPKKPTRRVQERTETMRASLIEAGKSLFSDRGFDAVSVRDIESLAGAKRNSLSYHFGDKETLWKASADAICSLMKLEFDKRLAIMKEISQQETLALLVRFYVRFHAHNPQLSRLMSQEATQRSWRSKHLVDTHIRPSAKEIESLIHVTKGMDREYFIHWYYIMTSGSSNIFVFASQCEDLFGVNPTEESMIEKHAEILVSMLLGK
ncbi:MAG: AcrR family transcriptional regulator [Paraglaciecola psychrophila]|jgi:AcrR family transcriptional regulator